VANVMVDGPITIPLMKRTGFRPPFAAAVEAVASTGGQIMPPVMGAAAFVMAEYLGGPLFAGGDVGGDPAVLYYVALFFAVHFEAKRYKLAGVPRSELPRFMVVMRQRGHLFVPIFVVLVGLIMGLLGADGGIGQARSSVSRWHSPASSRAKVSAGTRWWALEDGARNTLAVAMACACAGIVIGCVTITGLGIVFTQFVIGCRRSSLILALCSPRSRASFSAWACRPRPPTS
jgi:TRAP-type uncharacterized transport system fused permease subunit